MANAGAIGGLVFDDEVQKIEKQGKALQTGGIVAFVISGLAAAGAAWLAYDYWFRSAPSAQDEEKPGDKVTRFRITPTVGPRTWGLSGQFQF
jgi:hypothetical protein